MRSTGFWTVAVAIFATMSYTTVPTPLYPLYQERDGFPVWVITMIFAAFAVGVVCSLFLAGHLSDWAGRRRMTIIAVLLSALSAVLFLLWDDVPGLLTARFVDGVSIGILTATATAHLGELRARSHPRENPVIAASVAGAANLGGLAVGPVIGGVFAEYLPAPLILPHAVYLVLFVVLAVATCAIGLAGIATGALLPSFAVFLIGGVVAGVGVGILFRSAIATAGACCSSSRASCSSRRWARGS